jgi:hypothetical protein
MMVDVTVAAIDEARVMQRFTDAWEAVDVGFAGYLPLLPALDLPEELEA